MQHQSIPPHSQHDVVTVPGFMIELTELPDSGRLALTGTVFKERPILSIVKGSRPLHKEFRASDSSGPVSAVMNDLMDQPLTSCLG